MKKLIRPRHLPAIAVFAGLLGFVFRIWTIGLGPNSEGLYKPQPFAWTMLWILTAVTAAAILWVSRRLKSPGRYTDNFPASIPGTIGIALAALSCLTSAIDVLKNSVGGLAAVTAIAGLASTVCLILAAIARFTGKRPIVIAHTVPCLYFALLIFDRCKNWSNEPQIGLYVFSFLASICIMMATYQRACFDVGLGKRRSYLLWSLTGVYFCIVALPGNNDLLFYGSMAVWLLTNLCSLRPLTKRKQQPQEAPAPTRAEIMMNEANKDPEASVISPAENMTVTPTSAENMSMEELLDWLNKD